MYAKAKRSLPEMYAFTVCLWIKSNASPGVGTPFSYAVPGQANELVLIEWGNNPMEILINDKVRRKSLPPSVVVTPQRNVLVRRRDGLFIERKVAVAGRRRRRRCGESDEFSGALRK